MNNQVKTISYNYHESMQEKMADKPFSGAGKTTRPKASIVMGTLIVLFPKCPICWAVYLSMLGSLALSQLPYTSWLLPVLLATLAFHLFMLFRKSEQNGYLPFALSLAGAVLILSGRFFFPLENWLMIAGMGMIVSGSLLNSFLNIRLPIISFKKHTI
jgi:mercuric ion transport protein